MTREELDAYSDATGIELVVADGHDNAIVGVVRRFNDTFVLYDTEKVIKNLMADGMTHEEAVEFFEFNIVGAHVDGCPAFLEAIAEEA